MSRLLCENCDHGYAPNLTDCPWCGCSSQMAHTTHIDSICDTECYPDYWMAKFSTGETFQMFPGYPLDAVGLRKTLSKYRIITFNGINYDLPMIAIALTGYDNAQLRAANDMIIAAKMKYWDVLRQYNVQQLDWVDHIDLIEVAPGQASLKAYGGKMHSKKIQDLPIDPSSNIAWPDRVALREYCDNDLRTTQDLLETFPAQIKLREDMSAEYGVDLRSKSDAQIAEAVMKSLLPFKVERPQYAPGTTFFYRPPSWLTGELVTRVALSPFHINAEGGVAPAYDNHLFLWGDKAKRLDMHGEWVTRPAGWEQEPITIGSTAYGMGIGGLHSMESSVVHQADNTYVLRDHDVRGYYPSVIIRLGIYPSQIGPIFLEYFTKWKHERDRDKAVSEDMLQLEPTRVLAKKNANSKKTLGNGTFGKLGSMWSIFYAPAEMIQVTVTGQLSLLMLIRALESSGISVISANTDGIVVKCRRDMEWVCDDIVRWWETCTAFETERTDYRMLASRDVNSYIAIKTDGKVKLKGAFAPAEPGPSGWPNPTGQVCVDAVVAYLRDGVMLEDTIRECTDIRQFVYVRQVKGGGAFNANGMLDKKTSKKNAIAVAGSVEAYMAMRAEQVASGQFLGKVVRWYYAAGSKACITYVGSENLVPRSNGCKPVMELPDQFPSDIDYDWYVTEARGLLADLGVIL